LRWHRDGIRVNSVHPGIIDTPIWGKIPAEAVTSGPPIDGSPTSPRRKLAHELGISKAMTHGCIMLLGSRAADLNKHRTQCEPLLIEVGWSAARIAGIGIQNFM
jgi:NAD(P)-dependent dehydrogenase (short-subunit alcohol dehydrogenase family)